MNFNDFWGSRGAKIDEKSTKNRSKFEAQVGVPLGIDFSSIWGGLGSQVGQENRAKIDQKSKQKGINKNYEKKSASWRRLGEQNHLNINLVLAKEREAR